MSIRKSRKDHLNDLPPQLTEVANNTNYIETGDPLTFFTRHDTKPCFVDLTCLSTGQKSPNFVGGGVWNGPYSGRPNLIVELAPAIQEKLVFAVEITAIKLIAHLQWWWRLLDEIEAQSSLTCHQTPRVDSVTQLRDLHGRAALDRGCTGHQFGSLKSVADTTRQAMGLSPLPWRGPESRKPKRNLPPEKVTARVWSKLKHGWFHAIDRWKRSDALLAGDIIPESQADILLLENRHAFEKAKIRLQESGKISHPTFRELKVGYRKKIDVGSGRNAMAAYSTVYPTGSDIRYAFHLCLAGTGWNPQTLLDLTVDATADGLSRIPFLRNHPSQEDRFILTGFKERGGSFHDVHGDWKTDRSAGAILRLVVEKTWSMRQLLLQDLTTAIIELENANAANLPLSKTKPLWKKVQGLRAKSRSVWLFFDRKGIQSLTADSYSTLGGGDKNFLNEIVSSLNFNESSIGAPLRLTASDFRDAFAAYAWRSSGGSIIYVMVALGHRRPSSTAIYLNNTLINQESAKIYLNFSESLLEEIKNSERLDLTLLAKIVRDGGYTEVESSRLVEYRNLKRSRIGVSCKDPLNPPPQIDPTFNSDGKNLCHIQRCTLCLKNAVITKESMAGLCMRAAELRWLKTQIPIDAFVLGEFQQELENTEIALLGFDKHEVEQTIHLWNDKISNGIHRPVEFNGNI
ncbi:hypothetical protein [Comamonas sp. MYb69]|uniref:hypothetical protein n=1 Tax=Comamonas sp. MYb69 TaxID=1848650 RepID=UPI0030B0A4F5